MPGSFIGSGVASASGTASYSGSGDMLGSGAATAVGVASYSGSGDMPGLGVATADGTASYSGSASGVGSGVATIVDVDMLAALVGFLSANASLRAVLDDGQGGMKIYNDVAPPGAFYPYIVIEDYSEDATGETLDDLNVRVNVCVFHDDLDLVRKIANLVRKAVDTPAITNRATRIEPLSWAGGRETGLARHASRPRRLRGMSGGRYAWMESIAYEFWITTDPSSNA